MHADHRSERTRQRHRALTEKARLYLEEHYRERLRLANIAGPLGVSPGFLCHVFRRETGFSIHGYQTHLRLARARELILAGRGDDLTQLALELGFASHGHFTDTFRRKVGLPPSTFRRTSGSSRGRKEDPSRP